MITMESLASIPKDILPEISETLEAGDIAQLVEWLALEDDNARYKALLLLLSRSSYADDVYPFWDVFVAKLKSDNSYQRSIGLMLIADNAKWDSAGKMEAALEDYLALLSDAKPITVRGCIQGLGKIALHKPDLGPKIAERLVAFDLAGQKETMRKSILLDIVNTLMVIRANTASDTIEAFIQDALSGNVLDKKAKRQIEKQMGSR
ncbi:MAG TPA: hypothetical protein GXX23_06240 [Firmicutes bacterium]|nr:hypothetical protein [Candidatus Fermentithermobacillaceae bacterium]